MNDYKSTLNLPKTSFSMKANLAQQDKKWLSFWHDNKVYQDLLEQKNKENKFVLHDGPPYANGKIHLGHALNKILKDIIIKSKLMSGYYAYFKPGWDCHGLPIELHVEKKKGKAGHKIPHDEFRQICRKYAEGQVSQQKEDLASLGVFADWDNHYSTMSYDYEANTIRNFAKLLDSGYIHRGLRPVFWCFNCQSALADAEVEYYDKVSDSVYVKFRVEDTDKLLSLFDCNISVDSINSFSVPIWTTTAWTLPANQAVAINSEIQYSLIQYEQNIVILASDLVDTTMKIWGVSDYKTLGAAYGHKIEGIMLHHPFESRMVPTILGDHVNTEAGTGAVHTAPAHGEDDFVIGLKYGLPITTPVESNGCYEISTPIFGGLHINKVVPEIIEKMKELGVLIFHNKITHSYPHCWRHKTPLIFRTTSQWFINLEHNDLRKRSLESIKDCLWIPDKGASRISSLIENRPNWCISRQRSWGTPIPLFVDKNSYQIHPRMQEFLVGIVKEVEKNGIEAWFSLDPSDYLDTNELNQYIKTTDTLDVWFDSGVSHSCVLHDNDKLSTIADVYLEGSDQHRGWFQSSLLISMANNGVAPFKQVITHGFILDGNGKKMSKSQGNVIEPEKIIKTMGADILRLWVSTTDYSSDINISNEILKRVTDTYRRIRNTSRYLLSNLFDFNISNNSVEKNKMVEIDKYIIHVASNLQKEIINDYNNYNFHQAIQKISNFCTIDLGSFYLDVIKDRQYTCKPDSLPRRSCQTAMNFILESLVRWIAPILSFTAEEIWQHMNKKPISVFMSTWNDSLFILDDYDFLSSSDWNSIIELRSAVYKKLESLRNDNLLGSNLEAEVTIHAPQKIYDILIKFSDEIHFLMIVSKVELKLSKDPIEQGLIIEVERSKNKKCSRCWHHHHSVGINSNHENICERCINNIESDGEKRRYI